METDLVLYFFTGVLILISLASILSEIKKAKEEIIKEVKKLNK